MMAVRVWRLVERLAEATIIVLVGAMTLACLVQVVWRYALGDPLIWSEEAARYLFIWLSYLAAWLAWKRRDHIALDAVTYLNSPNLTRLSGQLVEVVVLLFCLYTFYTNLSLLALTAHQPSAILEIPMAWIYAGYSVMAALISGDILVGWLSSRHAPIPEQVSPL